MVTPEEFLSDLAKDLLDPKTDPMDRQTLVKGYARLMTLREEAAVIEGVTLARYATNPGSEEEKRIDSIIDERMEECEKSTDGSPF